MKNFKTILSLSVLAAFIAAFTLFTGCDSVSAVAKDKKNQVEKYLKDKTVLARANVQLDEAKKSRGKLKETADKFNVDAEVALRQVKRVEDEQAKSKSAFEKLQDIAKQAGLPKKADAKPEDLDKEIPVAGKIYTGKQVYETLKDYKDEVRKADNAVAREKTKADFLKKRADLIKNQMSKVDDNIDEMERQIEDYKMYQELVAANKTFDELGLNDSKMEQLLNTDNLLSALRKEVDQASVKLEIKDNESAKDSLKDDLNSGSKDESITDDDLI